MTELDLEQWVSALLRDAVTVAALPGNRLAHHQSDLESVQDVIAGALQKIERVKERAERLVA